MKDAYVEFKRTDNPTNDPKTQQAASVAHGGRGGGNFSYRPDRGQGPQTPDKCQMGLVPQSEVDKQTHIVNRHYSDAKWTQLTPAEQQKIWQLKNPSKTPGTGPIKHDHRRAVASTLTSSSSPGSSKKHQMEDLTIKSDQPAADPGWARNRDNPCLGRQVRPRDDDSWHAKPTNLTPDRTMKWSPDLTQTIKTSDQTNK